MDDGLTTIRLGGKLGSLFGREWRLRVSSPAEAIRAIDVNTGGKLRAYLRSQGTKGFYKVALGRKDNLLEKQELTNRSGETDIYILPTVRGAGSGVGKILTALALIVVAVYFPFALPGLTIAQTTAVVYTVAASLAIGGAAQLLTPTPNFSQDNSAQTAGSTLFNGNATAIAQGLAVTIVYGRALVAPMPVCISFSNEDVTLVNGQRVTTSAGSIGYTQVNLPGGGYQWVPDDQLTDQPS